MPRLFSMGHVSALQVIRVTDKRERAAVRGPGGDIDGSLSAVEPGNDSGRTSGGWHDPDHDMTIVRVISKGNVR